MGAIDFILYTDETVCPFSQVVYTYKCRAHTHTHREYIFILI
jgi:hypothetical protein